MWNDGILQSATHVFVFATTVARLWLRLLLDSKNNWQRCKYRLYMLYLFINHPFWQHSLRRCLLCMCWRSALGSDVLMDALKRTVPTEPITLDCKHGTPGQATETANSKSFSSIIRSNSKHLSTPLNQGQITPWYTPNQYCSMWPLGEAEVSFQGTGTSVCGHCLSGANRSAVYLSEHFV